MGYRRTLKLHVKKSLKLAKKSLKTLRGLVVFVGKPVYFFFFCLFKFLNYFTSPSPILNRKTRYSLYIVLSPFKIFPLASSFIILFLASVLFYFWQVILKDLPSPINLSDYSQPLSSKIYDRSGNLLYTIYEGENRSLVKLNELPDHTILATLAIEDNEFYQHSGFSVKGIFRAITKNLKEGSVYGGSTITQQLVKNTLLTPEKSLKRKIRELILAIEVEFLYSKNEILEMYMNNSPYGGTVYGIKEAAKTYFGKNVSELTLAESAYLSGIPKNPNSYSPFIGDPESSISRQKEVLRLMLANGYINEAEYESAISEKLNISENQTKITAPHFVMYVKDTLEKTYGQASVSKGGLEITTTLDSGIQEMAEGVVQNELKKLTNYKVTNAGVIISDPKSGEILAMVGSRDYFDDKLDGNVNTVFALRPPGSAIKAVNYAYALTSGYTAASIIDDSPVIYQFKGSPPYAPVNYDKSFKGRMSLRSAFAQSRNVPAVKVLNSYGTEHMIEMGEKLGISTWTNPKNYGLSMTLGGANTTLFDLAQAYSVFANSGIKHDLTPIIDIKSSSKTKMVWNSCNGGDTGFGNIPTISPKKNKNRLTNLLPGSLIAFSYASYSAEQKTGFQSCEENQVLDARVTYLITNILSDNFARTPTFGANSQLNIKNHKEVAAKTGTSNSMRDNIAIGYSQDYLVAVWVGNNNNSPMSNIASGITGATPIWNKIMTNLLENKESKDWEIPKGLVKKPICSYSKKPDSDEVVVKKYDEWFLEENAPKNTCNTPQLIQATVR